VYGQNIPGNKLRRTRVICYVNPKKYLQHFAINKNKFHIFKSDVISYDIKTIAYL